MLTKENYVELITNLGCKSMAEAGRLLGITPRQSQYYATGYTDVPLNIEKLLLAYLEVRTLRSALADSWKLMGRRGDFTPF